MISRRLLIAAWALIFLAMTGGNSLAQQTALGNQYLINDFSLSPAFAGANDNVESLISYRKDWVGIAGSPESRFININGALPKLLGFLPVTPSEMGIGATLYSEEAGIFRSTGISATFAYKLKVAAGQSVRLGLSLGVMENNINISDLGTGVLNDPVVVEGADVRKRVFDATFGVLYNFKKLNVGVAVPRLLETAVKGDSGSTLYTLSRHYIVHASYKIPVNAVVAIEPFAIARMTANSGLLYEAAAKAIYQDQWWLALMYRKGGTMGLTVGGELFDVVQMAYSYEFAGGMLDNSSGTHEISLGFTIAKSKAEAPPPTTKKPYYDWIK